MYSIKIVNRYKKSDYKVYNIRNGKKFDDLRSLQEFTDTSDDLCVGYIEPDHGWRGKLNNNDDIKELYSVCSKYGVTFRRSTD